ncbi:MAG: hypothetical protein JWL73_2559 [Actinomycetia bacterium]|nr:hypothetical protein [Actinomycetes bacterium]
MRAHQVRPYGPGVSEGASHSDTSLRYEIRLHGRLHARWTAWFDGLSVINESDGTTLLRGDVVDQAALHGLLRKLADLGLPLLSVMQIAPDQSDAPTPDPS